MTSQNWKDGALNKLLVHFLPAFTDAPFADGGDLKIDTLKKEVDRSHEAIYRWLRSGRLTIDNAKRLHGAALQPENLKALAALNRQPPTIRDFEPFYLED